MSIAGRGDHLLPTMPVDRLYLSRQLPDHELSSRLDLGRQHRVLRLPTLVVDLPSRGKDASPLFEHLSHSRSCAHEREFSHNDVFPGDMTGGKLILTCTSLDS